MFNLRLVTKEREKSTITYENSAFICEHRSEILRLASEEGGKVMHSSEIYFSTEEEMYSFASKISTLK